MVTALGKIKRGFTGVCGVGGRASILIMCEQDIPLPGQLFILKCVPERPEGSHICWEHHLIYYCMDSQWLLVPLRQFFNATFPVLVRHSALAEGEFFVEHGAGHCKACQRERDLLTGSARPSPQTSLLSPLT